MMMMPNCVSVDQSRVMRTANQLLELIAQFPMENPSHTDSADVDIPRLFSQIRSKYKMLCALVGVRSDVRDSAGESDTLATRLNGADSNKGDNAKSSSKKNSVWRIDSVTDGGGGTTSL